MSGFHEKEALLLRKYVGKATDENGIEYEMSLSSNVTMQIRSEKTGRTFYVAWEDILKMAIEAGVNND